MKDPSLKSEELSQLGRGPPGEARAARLQGAGVKRGHEGVGRGKY